MKRFTHISEIFEKKNYENVTKPQELIDKCKNHMEALNEVSLAKDDDGFYVRTHRASSERFDKPEDITIDAIIFIASTS